MHIFGSTLVKKLFPDFREPRDKDFHVTIGETTVTRDSEIYYIPCAPDRELTADEIYTVKCSHAIRDIHWHKTMSDIRFLQIKGCKLIPTFYDDLKSFWVEIHGQEQRFDFEDTTQVTLFKDKVEHDKLHELVKENDVPAYTMFVVDDVRPSKELFDMLSEDVKLSICREEGYVIALERYTRGNMPNVAYHKAQMDLITRLHPIWLAEYCIQNWNNIFLPKKEYRNHINKNKNKNGNQPND